MKNEVFKEEVLKNDINAYKKMIIYLIFYIIGTVPIIYFKLKLNYILFNSFLSFIPFVLTTLTLNIKKPIWLFTIITIIAIIFYPNSFYMFTDLIHINTSDYYNFSNGKIIYNLSYLNWIKLSCIVYFVIYSLILNFEFFINILKILNCFKYKFAEFCLLILFSFLSGIGVYIGRFLRFNSWNPLEYINLIKYLINDLTYTDYLLILIFTCLNFLLLLLFSTLKMK